jgi:hypothetical protein
VLGVFWTYKKYNLLYKEGFSILIGEKVVGVIPFEASIGNHRLYHPH